MHQLPELDEEEDSLLALSAGALILPGQHSPTGRCEIPANVRVCMQTAV
jgi:hypothetical protein